MIGQTARREEPASRGGSGRERFQQAKLAADRAVIEAFRSREARRLVHGQARTDFDELWAWTAEAIEGRRSARGAADLAPLDIHRQIVEGLPGEALYIASAMTFDSLSEALPFFDMTAKTARARLGERLSTHEGELALRIGRALSLAAEVLGSPETAREYLRTPNFALGGALPRDLLKTAEGEQIVLGELQAQADGGPV